jgi:hypothetical protein
VDESPPEVFGAMAAAGLACSAPEWFLRALWKEADSLARAYPEDDPVPGDFEEALDWIRLRPEVDANQQRAGWTWISCEVRRLRMDDERVDAAEWPVPCGARAIDGHAVVPLRSARDLREEGLAMRNCLATLALDCRDGRIAAFSIRRGGKRMASFTLVRVSGEGPRWKLEEIAGKANSAVPNLADIPLKLIAGLA